MGMGGFVFVPRFDHALPLEHTSRKLTFMKCRFEATRILPTILLNASSLCAPTDTPKIHDLRCG